MRRWAPGRELLVLLLLAVLPIAAHAPAWLQGRLLGPGDGTALHFPLRAAAWAALRQHELPAWNAAQFCGTPLLADYRSGVLYPPMLLLAWLPPFAAFQVLVLASLAATAVVTYLYLRRLHAGTVGAYLAGLFFSLGPLLVGHLDDTATVVAAPLLPLLLLAAESHMNRASVGRAAGLALALALLLVCGSPEAARAGAILLLGRIVVGYGFTATQRPPALRWTAAAVVAGLLLAAPQLLPTTYAAALAGRPITGIATFHDTLPGAMGLIMRYISHTPAAALALATLPLITSHASVRVLLTALLLSLAVQWGSPLSAHGVGPLVFDFTLSVLAGLSFGAQWTLRELRRGRRLRTYFLFFSLASAAALSVATSVLGPLPLVLTGPVGVLALSLILYFWLASSPHAALSRLWLLPLTVSFLLQPHGRDAWRGAATRREIEEGSPTRVAMNREMGLLREERVFTVAQEWPRAEALDLALGGLAGVFGMRSANGYDPMAPLRTRHAMGGMSAAGLLPEAFLRTDPARLDALGARWVQVPTSALATDQDAKAINVPIAPGQARLFTLPILPASEVHLVSSLSEAVTVPDGEEVARLTVRLASRRGEFQFPIRAGIETAEWAYDRADVRQRVQHARPTTAESWRGPHEEFEGHRYFAVLHLPGRYNIDAVHISCPPGRSRLLVTRLLVLDPGFGFSRAVSSASAFVSDAGSFREVAATPAVRLFERAPNSRAWVVGALRPMADDHAVLDALAGLTRQGIDPRREAIVRAADVGARSVLGGQPSRADVVRYAPGRIDVRAAGPGWLVIAESWDRGWTASRDGAPAPIVRVNHMGMGIELAAGTHQVSLRYSPPGFTVGLGLAAATAVALAFLLLRKTVGAGTVTGSLPVALARRD